MAIILCTLLAYSGGLQGPFIFDDLPDIADNAALREAWPLWRPIAHWRDGRLIVHTRPVVVLSFAANYAIGGLNVFYFHATNVLIHLLAGLTLFDFARRTLMLPGLHRFRAEANALALVIALLWLLHPLQTGAVTYVVQRYESMMGLFYLLTLNCALRAATDQRHARLWTTASVTACMLAMGCKEVAVSAPLMVLLHDRAFVAGSFRAAWSDRKALYMGLAATWLVFVPLYLLWSGGGQGVLRSATTGWAGFHQDKPWFLYALNQPAVILHYLRLAVWPQGQCLDYGWQATLDPMKIGAPIAVVGAGLVLTMFWTVRRPKWGFLGDWFFLILAPSSSIIPIDDLAFEHRIYLSLASVVVATVLAFYTLSLRWSASSRAALPIFWTISLVLTIALGASTFCRNRVYADSASVWQDVVAKSPDNPRALLGLACMLADAGKMSEAMAYYAILERDYPWYLNSAELQADWGARLMRLQQGELAIPHFLNALRLDPKSVRTRLNLAALLASRGYREAAIDELTFALEAQPALARQSSTSENDNLPHVGRLVGFIARACRIDPSKISERPVNRGLAAYEMGVALTRANAISAALVYFAAAEGLPLDDALREAVRSAKEAATQRLKDESNSSHARK